MIPILARKNMSQIRILIIKNYQNVGQFYPYIERLGTGRSKVWKQKILKDLHKVSPKNSYKWSEITFISRVKFHSSETHIFLAIYRGEITGSARGPLDIGHSQPAMGFFQLF